MVADRKTSVHNSITEVSFITILILISQFTMAISMAQPESLCTFREYILKSFYS